MTSALEVAERPPARPFAGGAIVSTLLRAPAFLALVALVLFALVGPFLVRDPLQLGAGPNLAPPSGDFWFGTDQFGMDIFARVVHAARLDLGVGVAAAALAVVIGMPVGALAALRGGIFDSTVLRVSESLQAFPTLLLALGIVAALGSSIPNLIVVIAVVNVPVYVRLTRSAVQPLVNADFVLAARCAGQRNFRIMRRQIMPNVAHVVLAQFSVNVAWAIQILAALSFVGLGVSVPTAEWGAMVRAGADYTIYGQWWVALFPGLAILASVLTFNQVSDSVRR